MTSNMKRVLENMRSIREKSDPEVERVPAYVFVSKSAVMRIVDVTEVCGRVKLNVVVLTTSAASDKVKYMWASPLVERCLIKYGIRHSLADLTGFSGLLLILHRNGSYSEWSLETDPDAKST